MADEEERIKAEKLAAAKKRVAQLQKQKKKASKKAGGGGDAPKATAAAAAAEAPADAVSPPSSAVASDSPVLAEGVEAPVGEDKTVTAPAAATGAVAAEAEAVVAAAPEAPEPVPEFVPAPAEIPTEAEETTITEQVDESTPAGTTEPEAEPEQTELQPEDPAPEPAAETPTLSPPPQTVSPTEPMPDAPTSLGPIESEAPPATALPTRPAGHGRQPSLSIQSKMRSSSFRKASVSQGSNHSVSPSAGAGAMLKSPSLPPLSADGEAVQEVYRKQVARIDELERENKRLEKEREEAAGRWKKSEEQLEDLREASVDVEELKGRLGRAEEQVARIEELKAEIASLQRQNTHLQTRTHRNNASVSAPAQSESPPADLVKQLESKAATIEAMELEISNLRAQLSSQSTANSTHEAQIAALEEKLSISETALEKSQRELGDTKAALTRASEKAVKEGVDKTSSETLIKNLQREVEELKQEKADADKKIETLEKKLEAMGNLHRESESRHQARLRESEKVEKEAAVLRKRLASVENENLRLKEEQETLRKREAGGADDDALDELEDEERSRLQRRIRDLEGEVFDLRRGVWQEKREELAGGATAGDEYPSPFSGAPDSAANTFDDVDLTGGSSADHARRRSMARNKSHGQHSSFSTVLSSGIAAFTGGSSFYGNRGRASSNQQPAGTRGSLELLSEENLDDEFDEAEFARAQAEEEARKRVEWVREIKRKLKDWHGWRLDLVDSRAGAEGAGVGMGEIFEI
ncbi:uncharacterized protein BP01DRAFT_418536 [Aspergillus saccharolyticus JOP 1030-1]|uniref:M protein repeat protein n=1 Tax=Aspergillus saccharolyticus JOP 1030-1 TaxID=1450539 RepID=A0A319A2G5_9EURO|nr:hypothetical protein BP01DRAFT_418536 [Aspergillus saccharolyticus JOP 1030-1]PYH41662.1 hypothetical protein BP01DRAFT_418536 [Aspergillus saccharolyticus JOP 1030-1]